MRFEKAKQGDFKAKKYVFDIQKLLLIKINGKDSSIIDIFLFLKLYKASSFK